MGAQSEQRRSMDISFLTMLIIASASEPAAAFEWPSMTYQEPGACTANQKYDISRLQCASCPKHSIGRGSQCECLPGYVLRREVGRFEKSNLVCESCGQPHVVTTQDGRSCIPCPPEYVSQRRCQCPDGHILLERSQSGQLLDQARCVACDPGTQPSLDRTQCIPTCPWWPQANGSDITNCSCSAGNGGICMPAGLGMDEKYIPSPADAIVTFQDQTGSPLQLESDFFKSNVKVASYLCYKHENTTACQMLANLCAMTLNDKEHPSCRLIHILSQRDRISSVPHLFFPDNQISNILQDESISNVYTPRSRLNITAALYDVRGRFLGLQSSILASALHLCNGSMSDIDYAFQFATRFTKKCSIPASYLLGRSEADTIFYSLFIPYSVRTGATTENRLFALPMLVRNWAYNQDEDRKDKWILTSRMFKVEAVSGIPSQASSHATSPDVVRYLKKMEIRVGIINPREFPEKTGRIFPPLVVLEYGQVSREDAKANARMEVEFRISYDMDMKETRKDIEIAVGVLSAFAVFWSALETWSWSRRSGKLAIDLMTLVKLLLNVCGNLSHAFLLVMYSTSLFWLVFFKQQNSLHVMLPSPAQEQLIKNYVVAIFALKVIDIVHLLCNQLSADFFLVDWERPKSRVNEDAESDNNTVSIWRTYLVANEWNELQTLRKINLPFQILCMVFLLKVCGLEKLASANPSSWSLPDEGHVETSYVCRFAIGVSLYTVISLLQVAVRCSLYHTLVEDKLDQFTDICSLANISVFAMAQKNFGYYIHGKSAHGFSDTGMATLLEQLQREADDLCGHRGLQVGSDKQTFSMTLPVKLRNYYDKVVTPVTSMTGQVHIGSRQRSSQLTGTNVQHRAHAYATMNKFLGRFLEHALKDLDYEVRDRMVLESVLDMEFQDASIMSEKAIFYPDRGHSFDALLLYGHELSLTVLDLTVFSFVDLFTYDFVLAAIITYFVAKLVMLARFTGGRRNLARKTLIDKRFLI